MLDLLSFWLFIQWVDGATIENEHAQVLRCTYIEHSYSYYTVHPYKLSLTNLEIEEKIRFSIK
jgi:hypothetical protein